MRSRPFVLLVNDIPDHRQQYEAALRARGYDVRLVSTGADALEVAATVQLEGVVIDVRLPDMTGWELCGQIKAIQRHCDVPIVILAPDLSKDSVTRSREAGCASWLMRPAAADDVARAVEQVLAERRSEPIAGGAVMSARCCPACDGDEITGGVRIGPVQYFRCRLCGLRWRSNAQGEATA
jgi:CheY-like chemotaxis protein